MPAPRTTTLTVEYSSGEVLKLTVLEPPEVPEGTRVIAGGLEDAAWAIASAVTLNVVGAAAYDYLKLGIRNLRTQLAWGANEDKRLYFSHIAYLEVATRVPDGTPVKVVGCYKEDGKWVAAVAAQGQRWRVEVPNTAQQKPEVMVYVDPPELEG